MIATAALLVVTLSQAPSEIRTQLASEYRGIESSMVRSDWKKFGSFMTDDFVAKREGTGPITKQAMIEGFKGQRAAMSNIKWKHTIEHLRFHGGVAQVTINGHFNADLAGQGGKTQHFAMVATSIDEWVPLHHAWKLRRTLIKKVEVKIDGKPTKMG